MNLNVKLNLDAKELVKKLANPKVQEYGYTIGFFLVLSFFVAFVIRPNIVTVFGLQKELADLQTLDAAYEKAIEDIAEIQTTLEQVRGERKILELAIPTQPNLAKVLSDIQSAATASGILAKNIRVNQLALKKQEVKQNELKQLEITFETNASFDKTTEFLGILERQLRLKTIRSISVTRDTNTFSVSSDSATLRVSAKVEGYQL